MLIIDQNLFGTYKGHLFDKGVFSLTYYLKEFISIKTLILEKNIEQAYLLYLKRVAML